MERPWFKHYAKNVPHEIDISRFRSIAHAFEQACERFGNSPAVVCMGSSLSYRQLDRLANRFASFLQNSLGVKKGDRIAIMLPNILQFPIVFLAAQKIGAVCVNTNPLYTPREMQHQFKDSGATTLVILDLFLDKLEKIIDKTDVKNVVSTCIGDQLPAWKGTPLSIIMRAKGLIPKHSLTVTKFKPAISQGAKVPLKPVEIRHEDVAILQYTGGTTGVAKGAMLTQKNILSNMAQITAWASNHISPGNENILTAIPLYHIFALTANFLSFLTIGCRMILVPKPIPIENTIKIFKSFKITAMTGVNTLFNTMNNSKSFQALAPRSLKFVIGGGMAVQEAVDKSWRQITGVKITQGFGLTEASPVTHCNPIDEDGPKGAIGLPLPSTDCKIVDDEGREVPIGGIGELIVKGPQVMKGYWMRDDETAKVIKDGWLWTGDVARQDENGYFYIVDRKKDMILVSGFNVYPNEVEDVLALHPKVLEAAVIGIPDGKGNESVKAFVVAKEKSLTAEELRDFCKDNLTGYKRPREFEFRESLPKSNVGKIIRRELRDEKPKN